MKEKKLLPALAPDALLGKSKAYIHKALLRKASDDLDEYQLWASLALELLGKAALANIHPALVADPTHSDSLFAACEVVIKVDVKTITAKTLFERLKHIISHFDEATSQFCLAIALRRNAELHSGDTPFKSMKLEAWEAKYWYATSLLLTQLDLSLDDWLGSDRSDAPKQIVKHAEQAKAQSTTIRIERASEAFKKRPKAERERAIQDAASRQPYHYRDMFSLLSDHIWEVECPSCSGKAFIAGIQIGENIVGSHSDYGDAWDEVETTYSAEQFRCPVCQLELEGTFEIEVAKLDTEHVETEQREMQFEPDYGND